MKNKNIVADTNIWYDIADGVIDVNKIKTHGRLCATPINLLELVSKLDDLNFLKRKKAAEAALTHADRFLQSNETYLVRYFNGKSSDNFDWKEGFSTLTKASSLEELRDGFIDFQNNVIRSQNTQLILEWREHQYMDFRTEVIKAVEQILPGYENALQQNGKIPKITNMKLVDFFDSDEFFRASLKAAKWRMKLSPNTKKIKINKISNEVAHKLTVYLKAYAAYLKYLATQEAKPQMNDLGDHEAFMYLQNKNWVLATSDKRWVNIAKEVCPSQVLNL